MYKKWSKQITAMVMALAMLLSAMGVFALEIVVPSIGGALWENGGFEMVESGQPVGYDLYVSGNTALKWENVLVQDESKANSGKYYVCAEKAQTGITFMASGLTEAKTYELSFFYKHDAADSTSASLLLRYAVDGATASYDKTLGLPVATEWTKHTETVVLNRTDASVTGENGLLINLIASKDANVCFDDIVLREQPAASLVSNGSFNGNTTGWTLSNVDYTQDENWDEGGSILLNTTSDTASVVTHVEANVIYKLTFMKKNAVWATPKVHIRSAWASSPYVNAYSFTGNVTNENWKEETLYFKAESNTAIIQIGSQHAQNLYIDGVKLTKAVDTFGFYTAEGEVKEITADLLGKDITAKWNRVGAADEDAMLITAVYKITGENTKQLVGIGTDAIDESSTALVQEISASAQIPSENGEYVVEAMFWESASGLSPLYRKETVR